MKNKFSLSFFITLIIYLILGIGSRLVPHPPNFTALNALAIWSPIYLENKWISLGCMLAILGISDCILGFSGMWPIIYIGLIGPIMMKSSFPFPLTWIFISLCWSEWFFLITNFMVWSTTTMYSHDLAGLGICYLKSLPFLVNQLLGDLFYGSLLLWGTLFLPSFDECCKT